MTESLARPAAPAREEELWREWLQHRLPAARSALFFFYAEWVRIVASTVFSRYPHPLAEWQDYVQFASQGVLKAIDRFDPAVQPNFKPYAEAYLKGDILRGLSCFTRDSRSKPDMAAMRAQSESAESGDFYSLEEIVDVAVGLAFGHFLELGISDAAQSPSDPLSVYESGRELGALMDYVERLPEREKQVVEAHYFQHLPFSEIALLLQVSRPRVTQLHQKALDRIRQWYEADSDVPDRFL